MSTRKGKDFHAEEDILVPDDEFHDEYEELDVWDHFLCDLRPKFRSLHDAWEEFRDSNQERYDT